MLAEPFAYNKKAAAAKLSLSERGLTNLMRRGEIGFAKIGRRCVRFTREHLAEYLDRKTVKPTGWRDKQEGRAGA